MTSSRLSKRDEVALRSEGALEAAEQALGRVERALSAPDWLMFVRDGALGQERVDDAVDAVLRVDLAFGTELSTRRNRAAELARRKLRELGVESRATRLEDLLAQLVARASTAAPAGPSHSRRVWAPWLIIAGLLGSYAAYWFLK
ncbi:MAG: hypothetical protein JNK82_12835 [Myxococcaceae bacterium]|nr:hypothetical protein [Myxococcaceae bacterium]